MRRYLLFVSAFLLIRSCFAGLVMNDKTASIEVANNGTFVAKQSIANYKGRLARSDNAVITAENISFDNGVLADGDNSMEVSGEVSFGAINKIILTGSKTFKGNSGSVLHELEVSGKGNRIEGNLQLRNDLTLIDYDSSVTYAANGRMPKNIIMNGGTIFLEEDLHFVDDMFFTGSGVVELNHRKLRLGSKEMTVQASLLFEQAQDIELNSNVHLASTWTCSAQCIVEGNNKIVYLEEGGNIVVEANSSLLLRGITIRGVNENNIRCLDSSSTLSFQNVLLILDDNYSFTIGSLQIINNLELKGSYTFAYQSAQTSTVNTHATLALDKGLTFSFDPIWNSNFTMTEDGEGTQINPWDNARNFLAFEDNTSELLVKGATIHVTTTNMKITKGIMRIKEKSHIKSELDGLFHLEEGFIIGNNNSDDDMKCEISGGATLELLQGALSYKNIQSDSFVIVNDRSMLFIDSGAKLKLHQNLDVCDGIAKFAEGSHLLRASGKRLEGAAHVLGAIYYELCYN